MNLEKISTISDLSNISSISEDIINEIIKNKDKFVKTNYIKKKKWWYRKIYMIVNQEYEKLVKFLNSEFSRLYNFDKCINWFVKWRWIITNAKEHLDKKIIINIDIKDFFESIEIVQIKKALSRIKLKDEIIDILIDLITINNVLPTWFSTSPTISNIICFNLDNDFKEFTKINWYKYTRYWDDITISTDTSNIIKKSKIVDLLEINNFTINEKKYKIQKRWWNRYVTWLTVCENNIPRIPKFIKKKLRQEAYYINKYWIESHIKKIWEVNTLFIYWEKSVYWWSWFLKNLEPKLSEYIIEKYDKQIVIPNKIQEKLEILK